MQTYRRLTEERKAYLALTATLQNAMETNALLLGEIEENQGMAEEKSNSDDNNDDESESNNDDSN